MSDAKREKLKQKIEAGEARHRDFDRTTMFDRAGERAIEAKDKFTAFAKEHPIITVAGAATIGVLVSSLFKRSPTRKLGRRAAGLAAIGAELAIAYAQQAMDTASDAGRAGAGKLEKLGENVGHSARDTAHRAGELTDSARAAARDAGKRLGQAIRDRVS